jgi:ribosome maturation factor RimP
MADSAQLIELFEPAVTAEGFALVRVKMIGGTSDPTLQIMAERPETRQLTLDECARLSRRLSEMLDELEASGADPIPGAYRLEVSSPGIDRPLTRLQDFADWAGHEARISLEEKLNGRKQFTGALIGIDGNDVLVDVPGLGEARLPFAAIRSGKLVLTDKLIASTAPISAEGADEVYEVAEPDGDALQSEMEVEED